MKQKRLIQICLLIAGLGAVYVGYLYSNVQNAQEGLRETPATAARESLKRAHGANLPSQPNFVVIVLDDADVGMFSDDLLLAHFPNIRRVAAEGIRFDNCHVTTPICAPSRASFLRGQYAYNTGVRVNDPAAPLANGFSGSFSEYKNRGMERDDISVWLQALGYRTMLVGKYLHHNFDFQVPAGWDDFRYSLGNKYFRTGRFINSGNPSPRVAILGADRYRTRVEADDAVQLIRDASRDLQPFFLYLTPIAPHDADRPDKRVEPVYRDSWLNLRQAITPDFNETDVSDKTSFADVPLMTDAQVEGAHRMFRDRMLAVKSVDDMVGRVLSTLEATGALENTYVIFTSDHGFLTGQHRLFGKCLPYSRATNVPLFVRGPGIAKGQVARHLIAHIDVAPTLVELAGGKAPSFVDGKSFALLLKSPESHEPSTWREPILIESWESAKWLGKPWVRPFTALRSFNELYVQWADGGTEYYPLELDPWELENQVHTLDAAKQQLFADTMRQIKNVDVPPTATVVLPEYKLSAKIAMDSEMRGYADDNQSVERVDLVIQDAEGSRFWNGVRWQSESIRVPARINRPGGLLTEWRYELKLHQDPLQRVQRVAISAFATDSDGNESPTVNTQWIDVDYYCPETAIEKTINNGVFDREARIKGTAWDNVKPESVRVTLRDIPNQQYWNGSTWTPRAESIQLNVSDKGRWHYILPLHSGRYGLWINAVDAVGNIDPTPATAVFEIR